MVTFAGFENQLNCPQPENISNKNQEIKINVIDTNILCKTLFVIIFSIKKQNKFINQIYFFILSRLNNNILMNAY